MVKELIAHDAPLNGTDEVGFSPLILAPHGLKLETIELMIEKGADVNAKDRSGGLIISAMGIAVMAKRQDVVKLLFDKGYQVTEYERMQLLERSRDEEMAKLFLNCPFENITRDEKSDNEALTRAVKNGYAPYLKSALRDGANPDTKNEYGHSLAMLAAWERHSELVRILKEAGANLDYQCSREYVDDRNQKKIMVLTPLYCAIVGYASSENKDYKEREAEKLKAIETIKIILEGCSLDTCYQALRTFFDNANTPGYSKDNYNEPMLLIIQHFLELSESARNRLQNLIR